MSDELDKILAEGDKPEDKEKEQETDPTPSEAELRKAEQLENLNKAIAESQAELESIRKEKTKAAGKSEEEDLPKINLDDPSAAAWDKHINDKVNPVQVELEKEKTEIRTFALKEFLADKPSISKNPEKLKELMATYEKIRTASERTKEGVLLDLGKAYAAVYSSELMEAARSIRVEKAQADSMFADIAVSRGASTYGSDNSSTKSEELSAEDKAIIAKWGMTEAQWQEERKKFK